jgi:hypothetical protein
MEKYQTKFKLKVVKYQILAAFALNSCIKSKLRLTMW